jgi:peroxiredoxin Q/BCP
MNFKAYILTFLGFISFGGCQGKQHLLVGSKAPDFTLKDDEGKDRSLHDFLGRKVVLYFYPKDYTPGCTKEACSLRDSYDKFEKNNIVILGVSYDSVSSHRKFKAKYKLQFILLSDSSKKVAKMYGAAPKWLFFSAPIASRMTFLIDEAAVIKAVLKDVDVTHHAQDVLRYFNIQETHSK